MADVDARSPLDGGHFPRMDLMSASPVNKLLPVVDKPTITAVTYVPRESLSSEQEGEPEDADISSSQLPQQNRSLEVSVDWQELSEEQQRQSFLQHARERNQSTFHDTLEEEQPDDYVYNWGDQEQTNRSSIDLFTDRMNAQRDGYTIRGLVNSIRKSARYQENGAPSTTNFDQVEGRQPHHTINAFSSPSRLIDIGGSPTGTATNLKIPQILLARYALMKQCSGLSQAWLVCLRGDNAALMVDIVQSVTEHELPLLLQMLCVEEDAQNSLGFAAYVGAVNCCSILLELGMDTANTDIFGRTALHLAALNGHTDCCALLVDSAYDVIDIPDYNGNTALHLAALSGYVDCVRFLLQGAAFLFATNAEGQTPLHVAKGIESIQCLLQRGASLIARDDFGRTPLYISVMKERNLEVQHLCSSDLNGESIDIHDRQGNTPAHVCCHFENETCLQELLKNGASMDINNEDGDSPRSIAIRNNGSCLRTLKTFEADSRNKFNWRKKTDSDTGNAYFFNVKTEQSLWEENVSEDIRRCFNTESRSNSVFGERNPSTDNGHRDKFCAVLPTVTEHDIETTRRDTSRDDHSNFFFPSNLTIDTTDGLGKSDRIKSPTSGGYPQYYSSGRKSATTVPHNIEGQEIENTDTSPATATSCRKDYVKIAENYIKERPYREAATGETTATCLICETNPAEEVFIPCDHACLCKKCISEHNVMSVPLAMKVKKAVHVKHSNKSEKPWTACPLCMQRIEAIVRIGKVDTVVRHYGGHPQLPENFGSRFVKSAELLRNTRHNNR